MTGAKVELECNGSWSGWRIPNRQELNSRQNASGMAENEFYPRSASDGSRTKHVVDVLPDGLQAIVYRSGETVAELTSSDDAYVFDCLVGEGEIGRIYVALESAPERRPQLDAL